MSNDIKKEITFEPDWKAIFERDFCEVCKHRQCCPYNWVCHDMQEFLENNENYYENIHDDNSENSA